MRTPPLTNTLTPYIGSSKRGSHNLFAPYRRLFRMYSAAQRHRATRHLATALTRLGVKRASRPVG